MSELNYNSIFLYNSAIDNDPQTTNNVNSNLPSNDIVSNWNMSTEWDSNSDNWEPVTNEWTEVV